MGLKKIFIGRKLFQPLFERLFKISLRGMNYGLGGIISSSGEIYLIKFIKKILINIKNDKKIIFDIGANDGHYSETLLNIFSNEDQIYSFEPSEFSFNNLVKKFQTSKNIELVNLGLGSKNEKRLLYYDHKGSGWSSVFERKNTGFNQVLNYSEEINICTLDDYCNKNKINKIHFIKADVEGFELEILKGSKEMLPNIDFIQFEFSFANYNSKTYLFDFFELLSSFKIFRILQDGIYEIQYDPRYEILMTTNYLAVNKNILKNKQFNY